MADAGEVQTEFYYYTAKAGDVARQLGLAGIAVIWLFCARDGLKATIPTNLWWPLLWLILSLAVDIGQYVLGTILWSISFARTPEQKIVGSTWRTLPWWATWTLLLLIIGKLALLGIGYLELLSALTSTLRPT